MSPTAARSKALALIAKADWGQLDDIREHNDSLTPAERFRDLTGAHPVIWVALILTLLLVALS